MSHIVQSKKYRNRQKIKDNFISIFIGIFAIIWMVPILWTFWTSLRPYSDIIQKGVFSRPDTLNFKNYSDAYRLMDIWEYLSNSFIVAIPAVILTLFFGSLLASSPSAHPGTNSSLKRTVIVLTFALPFSFLSIP